MTDQELLYNGPSILSLASKQGGLLLLVDDLDDMISEEMPHWLPLPLPQGLRVVATATVSHSTLQPNQINMIQDIPVKELSVRTFLLQYTNDPRSVEAAFGRQLARLKREELKKEGKEPVLQKKQIYANGQTVDANMYLESDRALFEQAWSAMKR